MRLLENYIMTLIIKTYFILSNNKLILQKVVKLAESKELSLHQTIILWG